MEEGAITASLWTGEVDEEKMLSVYHSEAGHTHTHTHTPERNSGRLSQRRKQRDAGG